ncbi:MAG TPA: type II toxin-antitoxin system VapC family toxin [Candidatus Dormibacteraeota bacterium]|nr:type II toxin-antitoxin system VapC family toxin [Candidatus Dormibacteraeota bacterium]
MKLLLDTNAVLWLLNDDARLGPKARQIIKDSQDIAVSEVSLWEISIKISIGKLQPIPELLDTVHDLGFRRLRLDNEYLRFYEKLPLIHRDPFDRMLVAQASVGGISLVTSDTFLKDYGINVVSTS